MIEDWLILNQIWQGETGNDEHPKPWQWQQWWQSIESLCWSVVSDKSTTVLSCICSAMIVCWFVGWWNRCASANTANDCSKTIIAKKERTYAFRT